MKLFLTVLFLMVVSCGSNDSEDSGKPILVGQWRITTCFKDTSDNTSYDVVNIFTDTKKIAHLNYYYDSECKEAMLVRTTTSPYSIGNKSTLVSTAYEIDLHEGKHEITPKSKAAADNLNAAKSYEYLDWAVDVPKEVQGRRPQPDKEPYTITPLYSIFKREGDTLIPGDTDSFNDGTTKEKRFNHLSTAVIFTKY